PNPAGENFNLEIISSGNEEAVVALYTTGGQMMFSQKANLTAGVNNFSFRSHEYAKGIYFMQVVTQDKLINQKLIIR
ncbi:MAG: T9SS type A sorting domain-containing protein, partial [Bacteroidetes bacterium]|nr:T9SS type A sorting domain-containing protein [Bacteroidota bacterium]